jgi:hypothetical protein
MYRYLRCKNCVCLCIDGLFHSPMSCDTLTNSYNVCTYVCIYVDVSRALEERATANLEREKLLAKTGISLLILLH